MKISEVVLAVLAITITGTSTISAEELNQQIDNPSIQSIGAIKTVSTNDAGGILSTGRSPDSRPEKF